MRFLLPPDRGAVRAPARAAVLADWMRTWTGEHVDVDIAPSYRDLALAIERAEVDLAWAPPAVVARVRASVRTALTLVRNGATSCRAALVVREGAGIADVRDLAGKRASWVDPLSTSGHLMALAHLHASGLDPRRIFGSQRFAGSYRDALGDVLAGRADVTSMFVVDDGPDGTIREIQDIVGAQARTLSILCTTEPAPYDALVVPRGAAGSSALEQRILELHPRTRPPAMLLEVCRAERFVRSGLEPYAQLERALDAFVLA